MKRKRIVITGIVLLFLSVSLFLYPTINNTINQIQNKNTIQQYDNTTNAISNKEKEIYLSQAKRYNQNLSNIVSDSFSPNAFNLKPGYDEILSFAKDRQIGTVNIPKIDVSLPIYHGTSEKMLEKGAVHMANTSFPIGGKNTHSVISAHTAFPGKVFFDKLTDLTIGDVFYITVLGDTLTYHVCDIYIVSPTDTSKLKIEQDKDYVTLVTCTPYSINTHRLLVRGERTTEISTPDSTANDDSFVFPLFCISGIVLFLLLLLFVKFMCPSGGHLKGGEK